MKNEKNIKAYSITHPIALVILIVVLISSYLLCCFLEKQDDNEQIRIIASAVLNHEETIEQIDHPVRDAIKNLLVIFISILLSSIVTIAFVGKNDRNAIYSDAFEDLIENSDIQIKLPEKKGNSVKFSLEKCFKEKNLPKELLETVIRKVASPDLPYYYSNCTIDILCRFEGDILVKTVKKDLYIKSYDDKYTFSKGNVDKKFIIARRRGSEGIDTPLKINKFFIYRNSIAEEETSHHSVVKVSSTSPVYKKIGYTNAFIAYYEKDLSIGRREPTHVTVEYETRSPKDDLTYVFRVPCACEHLSFKFRFDSDEYQLTGHAFGFFDDARETINSESENALSFVFENWIFKRDGICISIIKKE